MSYNLLAPSLARLSSRVPEWVLQWDKREAAVVAEVRRYRPSIVCFQEVDWNVWPRLLKRLQPLGYDGHFLKRSAVAEKVGAAPQANLAGAVSCVRLCVRLCA